MIAGAVRAIAHLLLFIFIFSLEIRVRAAVEEPVACWKSGDGACAVKTAAGEKLSLELEGGHTVLDEATTLVRVKNGELRLLSGQIWVRVEAPLIVGSEYGEFSADHGEFWVSRTAERVTGSAVSGVLKMSPRGSIGEELEIQPGLENWLGKVQLGTRRAQTGVPMAISFSQHLSRWARLYSGGRAQFAKEAQAFHEIWLEATGEAAGFHQQLFERKMASLKEREKKDAEARRKVEARNRELIEMFKHKVFDP